MSRNPYHQEGAPPTLRRSLFAFIDILGYQGLITRAEKDNQQQAFLSRLHGALVEGRKWLEDKDESLAELKKWGPKDLYALKAFTDNIVIAFPIRGDAESELGFALSKLIDFQFSMSLEGFFIRGAISIGDAYVDDVVVFGDALMKAYSGESRLARDPRIVLTEELVKTVKQHLDYYIYPSSAPHVRELLCDSDGQWFVNYLDCILLAVDDVGPFYNELLRHKSAIEAKLTEYKDHPPIFSKYAWVANYHNYFCDLHNEYFSAEYKIETDLFRAKPKLITD